MTTSTSVGTIHAIIPDTQCKPGVDLEHLRWAGEYLALKKPDVIIHLGDHWDMESLSIYDKGKMCYEGRTYTGDIAAGRKGMELLMTPILKAIKESKGQWQPRLVFLLGNHEQRIERAIQEDRKLHNLISYNDFKLEEYGWEVHPFLQVVQIDGICYSHYFTSGAKGNPVSSAAALVSKKHISCVMGHTQKTEMSLGQANAMGKPMLGLFAGFYYQHDEVYLGQQGNPQQRQLWLLREVNDGFGYPQAIPLDYLRRRFGKGEQVIVPLSEPENVIPTLRNLQEARQHNEYYYYTGIPCVNGHIAKRKTNTQQCVECIAKWQKERLNRKRKINCLPLGRNTL